MFTQFTLTLIRLKKMIDVQILNRKFFLEEILKAAASPSHGAQCTFSGMVRNHNQGKKVLAVSYDTFDPLTLKSFRDICTEAQSKWGEDLHIHLWHRKGRLHIGELSVAIVISAKHRDESYKASRYIIEELKKRCPIWKKEHYEDGDSDWLHGHALCSHAPNDHLRSDHERSAR
jgi:molybdopterin synthase catalytic subunit